MAQDELLSVIAGWFNLIKGRVVMKDTNAEVQLQMRTGSQLDTKSPNRPHIVAFISAIVGWIFDFFEVALLTFLIIPIAKQFHITMTGVALVFSVQLLFLAVGGIAFGVLADKIGRQRVLYITILVYAFGTLMRAFTFNYTWLMFWTIFAAFGIGGEYGVGQTLVSELTPKDKRGFWGGLLYGGIFIGIALAAVVGGYIEPAVGWRWTFAIASVPVFVAIYIRSNTPESRIWEELAQTKSLGHNLKTVMSKMFIVRFLQCLLASCLQFFAYYGIAQFLPTYLTNHGLTITKASWWVFFTAVAGLVGNIVGSITQDRWGRRVTLSYLAVSAAIGGGVLFFFWKDLLTSPFMLIPFFVLFFGSNGATVFGVLFSELFESNVRATAVSSILQGGRGLAFFAPIIAAALIPHFGFQVVVLMGAAEFLALGAWAWTFPETRGVDLEQVIQNH